MDPENGDLKENVAQEPDFKTETRNPKKRRIAPTLVSDELGKSQPASIPTATGVEEPCESQNEVNVSKPRRIQPVLVSPLVKEKVYEKISSTETE